MRSPTTLRASAPRRRGSALVLVLVFTTALAMLALSAIYLTSGATILGRSYERERDLRLVAEAGLALGKARLNSGASVLPTTGFSQIIRDSALTGADGSEIADIRLNVYVGPTGGGAGSRGRFASVVAESRDARGGGRFVRRVELAEESFARFAYFTDQELSVTGTPIYFARGDVLIGPVWSNDDIRLTNVGTGALASFFQEVGTAGSIESPSFGTFARGYRENQPEIELPNTSTVSRRLEPIAEAGRLDFDRVRNDSLPNLRFEFFAMDMNRDGDSTDANEGFFKAYRVDDTGSPTKRLLNAEWLKGNFRVTHDPNYPPTTFPRRWSNCGDWHMIDVGGTPQPQFFPLEVHRYTWFRNLLEANVPGGRAEAMRHIVKQTPIAIPGTVAADYRDTNVVVQEILSNSSPRVARCFLGGDPHLIASATSAERGGTATTFYERTTLGDLDGQWLDFPGATHREVEEAREARGMDDADFVFPLHADFNSGSLGVIHVDGSVGVSGVVNGGVTLYAQNTIHILDDITYATPGSDATRTCNDILGLISGDNTLVSDNGVNTPQDVEPKATALAATPVRALDGNPARGGVELAAIIMSLNTSFRVESYSLTTTINACPDGGRATADCTSATAIPAAPRRPVAGMNCLGQNTGRGCIFLFGGVIQQIRGQVARGGGADGVYGFAKNYDYDRCAATNPPPFFPTIGRFVDNRFFEIDPLRFSPAPYFAALAPR